ncbi:hypothetical protein GCM10009550_74150 [Actinocorallia libanotica]|uniref:Uncharacterized protein n=1 Tax=Actinocorallia libanotica TaxID=46162 RepID=A0ABN1RZH5_9ACTN
MAEAFFDDLEVGAACEEPGGMGVAEVVHLELQAGVGGTGRQMWSRNQWRGMRPSVFQERGLRPDRRSSHHRPDPALTTAPSGSRGPTQCSRTVL